MSGHSKWSKVKHQKATTDVVKAKAFTKASRAITIAVKEGGGLTDPNGNFRLRLAIEQARAVNMPKENIERAIVKGKAEDGQQVESLVYEAYGPHGVALIIEAASENKQRTVSAIKNILDRHSGTLAAQGSVLFQFKRVGIILIGRDMTKTEDDMLSLTLEVGGQDMMVIDENVEIFTSMTTLFEVKTAIESKGIVVNSAEIIYIPVTPTEIPDSEITNIEKLIDALEDLDDIQRIYTTLP